MSSEEEPFVEDKEYQSTQKEIEELRKREEELMMKINALEKKQRSVSANSLEEKQIEKEEATSDNDEEETEELGKRRRPSLSRGSSKSSESMNYRPKSLEFENQAGTFRSRSSRSSSTSPTKETKNSPSSSRGNLNSPNKDSAYSSRSKISIRQSSARVTSETTSPIGKGYRIEVSSSGAFSPTKEDNPRVSSKTKMVRSYSATSSDKSPRNSETVQSKSSKNSKIVHRRSFPASEDDTGNNEVHNEKMSYSTTRLSKTNVPENKLSDREKKDSRDSFRDERSRSSIRINEDSYEIIEIGDDKPDQSQAEEKTCLSAREKIEMELVEQREREEELRMTKRLSGLSGRGEEIDKSGEHSFADESTDDEYDNEFDQANGARQEESDTLSTWEKIALEIEEEKRREDEIKKKKTEEEIDEDSAVDGSESASEEERSTDVFKRITEEIEEQRRREKEIRKFPSQEEDVSSGEESNGEVNSSGLSVQDRIELEIKEIEKRESELKKMHNNSEEQEDVLEEEEEVKSPLRDTGAKTKIQQEIDEFRKKESEFRKLHGVDDESFSDDEGGESSKFGSMTVIEQELAEQRRKEREFRREHKHELQRENEEADEHESKSDGDDDEIPEDESMLIERTKRKIRGSSDRRMETSEKSDVLVAPGITKKFIHLFDKGVEKSVTKNREAPILKTNRRDERPKINGQSYSNVETNDESVGKVKDVSFEEDDGVKEDEETELDIMKEETEIHLKEESTERQHAIDAPSPGKKLVLKRKKSKDRKQEQQDKEGNEDKTNIPYGSKEEKPVKKAHPLAMQWEKMQNEKQREAMKYDYEMKKRQLETERRRKRESEEKQERERIRAQQEKQDLQNRRKSLAESWEKKSGGNTNSNSNNSNNNNNNSAKENQSSSKIATQSKNEIVKAKSPRRSPAVKKERITSRRAQETPKSTRANIQMWEQRIASSKKI